jgi:hypothetical protein
MTVSLLGPSVMAEYTGIETERREMDLGIAVYPRLDALLRERGLTVAELERRIERQFGMRVDPKTLYRLTHADPVQRADLEIAGAAATILGVGLDDIFDVQATPTAGTSDAIEYALSPEQSRRMSELFRRQDYVGLTTTEQAELQALVNASARQLHELRIREIAELRGVSVEQARHDVAQELEEALKWWEAFEADPENRRRVVAEARRRRRRGAE